MSTFGQIPTAVICQFQHLSKREIIVLSYLYACRNRQTGRCNPRQKQIAECTGMWKSHVSTAIKTLEQKGLLALDQTGEFHLNSDVESYQFGNSEVTNSVTKVTVSVTKVTNSVTQLNKDLKHTSNTQEHSREETHPGMLPSVFEHPAVQIYEEKFCLKIRNNFAKEIAARVTDLDTWSRLIRDKIAYADRPLDERQRVANWILQEYDKRVEGKTNGTTNKSYQDRRAELAREQFKIESDLRQRIRERDRGLSGAALSDNSRQLQPFRSDAD